jgi:hypothetical protein
MVQAINWLSMNIHTTRGMVVDSNVATMVNVSKIPVAKMIISNMAKNIANGGSLNTVLSSPPVQFPFIQVVRFSISIHCLEYLGKN